MYRHVPAARHHLQDDMQGGHLVAAIAHLARVQVAVLALGADPHAGGPHGTLGDAGIHHLPEFVPLMSVVISGPPHTSTKFGPLI